MVVLIGLRANNGGNRCGCVCTHAELVSLMLVAEVVVVVCWWWAVGGGGGGLL